MNEEIEKLVEKGITPVKVKKVREKQESILDKVDLDE